MDKFDRIQKLHRILRSHRRPVPKRVLAEQLECSERNVQRIIESMQLYLDAPLAYDPSTRGWHYEEDPNNRFELPGLWLTSEELQALSLLINLLDTLGRGLLDEDLRVIDAEIRNLLEARGVNATRFMNHVRVLPIGNKPLVGKEIHTVAEALLKQQRLDMVYTSYNHQQTERQVSPLKLVYYRENWYLDAWCHLRNELRTFSVARINRVQLLREKTKKLDKVLVDRYFSESYGIFAGKPRHTARLRFLPAVAREVASQQWHPDQAGEWQGRDYILTIPYSVDKELVQDILRHTPHVIVEAPAVLKKAVKNKLQQGLENYLGKGLGWL